MALMSADRETLGTFALTFDTELIWGSFDHTSPERFEQRYPGVRDVIRSLLDLLARYDVAATWAIVGHLYLSSCRRDASGLAHPELVRPGQRWRPGDWYAADPCTSLAAAPLWYGPDIVDMIQECRVPQEIGCHSFSHILYGDPDLDTAAVDADLAACLELARARGITLRSFVFPRNVEGHHEALARHGFRAFRGADPNAIAGWPRPLARPAHLAMHGLGLTPPVSRPTEALPGLWNIPGSTLFLHRTGIRRAVTRRARVRRAAAGLEAAVREGAVFHLWTHPFNIASDAPTLLGVLEEILQHAVRLRDAGRLRIETMDGVALRAAAAP